MILYLLTRTSTNSAIRQILASSTDNDAIPAYVAGLLTGMVVLKVLKYLLRSIFGRKIALFKCNDGDRQIWTQKGLYGFEHAVLNVEVPPKSMWMNMGYWEDDVCAIDSPLKSL